MSRFKASSFIFFGTVIAVMLAMLLVGYTLSENIKEQQLNLAEQQIALRAEAETADLNQLIDSRIASVNFLSNTPPILGLYRSISHGGIDPYDGTTTELWQSRLNKIFVAYLTFIPEIYQLRYIGIANNGKELVRVERENQVIQVADGENLQEKGQTDYFQAISRLRPGQVYVSQINLNREHGFIENPHKPTVRIAVPIFGDDRKIYGFVIANIDLSQHLASIVKGEQQTMILLDQRGNFLAHPNKDYPFRFEYGEGRTWDDIYDETPVEASELKIYQSIFNEDSILLGRMYPLEFNPQTGFPLKLTLIAATDHQRILDKTQSLSTKSWAFVVAAGLIIICILALYQRHSRNQQLMNAQLAQYESIFRGSMDGIFTIDQQLKILNCNQAAQDITREPARFVEGRNITQLFPGITSQLGDVPLDQLLQDKPAVQTEYELQLPNGQSLVLLVSIFKAYGKNETALYGLIAKDVTEAVKYREEIQASNQRLEELVEKRTAELKTETAKALKANEAINSFVANISHELRTPINGVMGMLSILEGKKLPEEVHQRVHSAYRSSENLLNLVNNILDISKIEAGKIEVEMLQTDLREDFSQLMNSLSVLVKNKSVQLLLDLSELHHPMVEVDTTRLKQIVTNLLSNAIKFTSQGEIRLTAKSELTDEGKVHLEIKVSDTGVGIKKEQQNKLFDKFTQEDNSTTRKYGGTGLGLAIAKEFAELLGGDITVFSEKNQGTTFSLNFTLNPVADREDKLLPVIRELTQHAVLICSDNEPLKGILDKQFSTWGMQIRSISSKELSFAEPENEQWLLTSEAIYRANREQISEQFNQVFIIADSVSGDGQTSYPGVRRIQAPVTPASLVSSFGQATGIISSFGKSELRNPHQQGDLPDLSANTILIVDDNDLNIDVAEGLLADCGPNILRAHDGKKAIQTIKASEDTIDLILMDCQMPEMDGYSATANIRAGGAGIKYISIPIIALTAGAMQGDKDRCLQSGMDDYLTKPIIKSDLYSKVLFHLSRDSESASSSSEAIRSAKESSESSGGMSANALLDGSQQRAAANDASHTQTSEEASDQEVQAQTEPQTRSEQQSQARSHQVTDSATPDLNLAAALDRLGGKKQLWESIVKVFIDTYPEKLESLEEQINAQNPEKIGFWAHNLKGICASAGLDNATRICLEMEQTPEDFQHCLTLLQELSASIEKGKTLILAELANAS